MNAKLVLAICGCALAGALVTLTSGRAQAQSADAPARSIKLPTSGAGAIWGDEQNVFVLVGDRLFKVRKYDMKIDRSVALRTTATTAAASTGTRTATSRTGTTHTATQQIVRRIKPKAKTPLKKKIKPIVSEEE